MTSPTVSNSDPQRLADIRAIHAMARQLALTDDSYRALVSRASNGRTDSSKDLDAAERDRLLDRLRALGGGGRVNARRLPPRASEPEQALLRALWLSLYWLGEIDDRTDAGIDGWVAKTFKLTSFRFADRVEVRKAIEALKSWCTRLGYPPVGSAIDRRVALIRLQWQRLRAAGAIKNPPEADRDSLDAWADREQRMAGAPRRAGIEHYEAEELDRIIRALGRWVRRVKNEDVAS